MKDKILDIAKAKHKASNGSCGTYIRDIANQLQLPYSEAEAIAGEMYNDGIIEIRPGIHGYMVMMPCEYLPNKKSNGKFL